MKAIFERGNFTTRKCHFLKNGIDNMEEVTKHVEK